MDQKYVKVHLSIDYIQAGYEETDITSIGWVNKTVLVKYNISSMYQRVFIQVRSVKYLYSPIYLTPFVHQYSHTEIEVIDYLHSCCRQHNGINKITDTQLYGNVPKNYEL